MGKILREQFIIEGVVVHIKGTQHDPVRFIYFIRKYITFRKFFIGNFTDRV